MNRAEFVSNSSLARSLSPEKVAQLQALLGPDLAHEDELTRRLSLPRTFNHTIYELACRELQNSPAFEEFTAQAATEPSFGQAGRFSIRESVRTNYLTLYWAERREERREWVHVFGPRLRMDNEIERMDRLQLLFYAEQDIARAEWSAAFEAADARNDLAACAALVELVALAVQRVGDGESITLWRELKARQQARNLFYNEFFQTETYLSRETPEKALEDFIQSDDGRWIFQLHATGGMGKTTLLRRLISHRWVTKECRYPCAWIDFDYLDFDAVLKAPALLSFVMAAEWNEQLEQPIFGSVLEPSYLTYASLLFRTRIDGSAGGLENPQAARVTRAHYLTARSNPMQCGLLANVAPPDPALRGSLLDAFQSLASYLPQKCGQAMARMPAGRPVLLFLDTLEVASHRRGEELRQVLIFLRILRSEAWLEASLNGLPPVNFKVILSGRYHLGVEHVKEFKADFANEYVDFQLGGFEDEDARKLLATRLHGRFDALVPAILERSAGSPLSLSLFAEWALEDPALTEEMVRDSKDISAAVLIERIIKRISEQPLRWVIRYGVIPRTLSREFLDNVMKDPLVDALSGRAQANGQDPIDSGVELDVWLPEKDFQFNADILWSDVVGYTSAHGWLMPEGQGGERVRFRPDVLQSIRRLLRPQPIFQTLHKRAREWFAAQIGKGGNDVALEMESIYHEAQLCSLPGRDAGELLARLRKALCSPAVMGDLPRRRAVADALRGPDFADMPAVARGYVEYCFAEVLAAQEKYKYLGPEAKRALQQAFDLVAAVADEVLPPFAGVWQAACQGAPASELRAKLSAVMSVDDNVQTRLLISETVVPGSPLGAEVLKEALTVHYAGGAHAIPRMVIEDRLGRALRILQPDEATSHFLAAAAGYHAGGDFAAYGEMLRLASAQELSLGRLTRAEAILKPGGVSVEHGVWTLLQTARLELAKGQPALALRFLERIQSIDVESTTAEKIEASQLEAETRSQGVLWSQAYDAWQVATTLATHSGDRNAAFQCFMGQLRFERWWLRRTDLPPVSVPNLTSAGPTRPFRSDELTVWRIFTGPGDPGAALLRELAQLAGNSPAGEVRMLLALSSKQDLSRQDWERVLRKVKQIPRSARFLCLVEPVLLGAPPTMSRRFRESLAEAMGHEPEGEIESAWYGLRYGEWLAWLGFHREALKTLRRFVPRQSGGERLDPGWRAAVHRERRRVEQRLRDWGASFATADPVPFDFWMALWTETPMRAAAASIENAVCARDARDFALVRRTLELVDPVLRACPFSTDFHRMANELAAILEESHRDRSIVAPESLSAREARKPPGEQRRGSPLMLAMVDFSILEMHPEAGNLQYTLMAAQLRGETVDYHVTDTGRVGADFETTDILLRSEGIPRGLVRRDHAELADELAMMLAETGLPSDRQTPVCLQMPLGVLAAVPWELAFPVSSMHPWRIPTTWSDLSGAPPRQVGPSGDRGDAVPMWRTRVAFPGSERAKDSSDKRPGAAVFQPFSPQNADASSADSYWYLARAGLSVRSPENIARAVREYAVIHVAASFVELPNLREPVIAGWEMNAAVLARHFQEAGQKPAIILDVPPMAGRTQWMHQLLLRNYFAQALLDSGAVTCVLAAGLAESDLDARSFHNLFHAAAVQPDLKQSDLLLQVVELARRVGQPCHHALFSRNPEQPFI